MELSSLDQKTEGRQGKVIVIAETSYLLTCAPRIFHPEVPPSDEDETLDCIVSRSTSLSESNQVEIGDAKKTLWIARLCIKPDLQGKGLGRAILLALHKLADAGGESLALQSQTLGAVSHLPVESGWSFIDVIVSILSQMWRNTRSVSYWDLDEERWMSRCRTIRVLRMACIEIANRDSSRLRD